MPSLIDVTGRVFFRNGWEAEEAVSISYFDYSRIIVALTKNLYYTLDYEFDKRQSGRDFQPTWKFNPIVYHQGTGGSWKPGLEGWTDSKRAGNSRFNTVAPSTASQECGNDRTEQNWKRAGVFSAIQTTR